MTPDQLRDSLSRQPTPWNEIRARRGLGAALATWTRARGLRRIARGAGVVVVTAGVTDGVGVARDVGVGVVEGAGVDDVAGGDWTGPTRLGPVLRRPVSNSAIASPTTVPTAITPPAAMPVAKACRSRRYSVARRSRSQSGSAARRAAQLLNGAAAMPSVGTNSRSASSGPLSVLVLVSAAAAKRGGSNSWPGKTNTAESAKHR